MKNTKSKRLYLLAGLSALLLAPVGAALGKPAQCITDDTKCDHDLLCAFKVELAEKILLFETFVANSPTTQAARKGTLQGVKYNGKLYQAALAEARAAEPGATGDDLAALAYSRFTKKVREKLRTESSKYKECKSLGVTPNETLRGTWTGMRTSKKDCTVYGDPPNDSEVGISLDDLKKKSDGCLEIWESDRGHEAVHEDACRRRLANRERPPLTLQNYIDEDTEAYRYNVQHAANDLSKMQLLCTADPKTDDFRKRADDLLKKAAQYRANQAGK
ncbi:MAG TPA: hypothetical protein VEQ59_04870 [Polyangiaceae bacterium]|nr:hypothetical protein [Polyangiaceae bacterium]